MRCCCKKKYERKESISAFQSADYLGHCSWHFVGDLGYPGVCLFWQCGGSGLSLCLFWPCPSHLPLQWPASGAHGDPGGRAAPHVGRAARRGCGSAPARPRRTVGPAARAPTHSCNSATAAAVQVRPHCSLPSPPLLVVNAFCF